MRSDLLLPPAVRGLTVFYPLGSSAVFADEQAQGAYPPDLSECHAEHDRRYFAFRARTRDRESASSWTLDQCRLSWLPSSPASSEAFSAIVSRLRPPKTSAYGECRRSGSPSRVAIWDEVVLRHIELFRIVEDHGGWRTSWRRVWSRVRCGIKVTNADLTWEGLWP